MGEGVSMVDVVDAVDKVDAVDLDDGLESVSGKDIEGQA